MSEQKEFLEKSALQRAAIMALIVKLLEEKKNLTMNEVKNVLVNFISSMIDENLMVGDLIDLMVAKSCKKYLEDAKREMRAEEGGNILKNISEN